MPHRPYILNELTWETVREAPYEIAVLPWGATEAHNFHLPYSTDNVETEAIAARAAQRASEQGARVVDARGWGTPNPGVKRSLFFPMAADISDDERERAVRGPAP